MMARIATCVLACVVAAPLVTAEKSEAAADVDGVKMYGRTYKVSDADLREAMAAYKATRGAKPVAVEVINPNEIHVWSQDRERGWRPVQRLEVHQPDGRVELKWMLYGRAIWIIPEALKLMGTARTVYVFPVATPFAPHRDDRHLRLLGTEARISLERLLGNEAHWLHGFDNRIWPEGVPVPTDIGLLFKDGGNEAVLYLFSQRGWFNGEESGGSLDIEVEREFEAWKQKYAQAELDMGSYR